MCNYNLDATLLWLSHCTWPWVALLLDQREQGRQKLPRIWAGHWVYRYEHFDYDFVDKRTMDIYFWCSTMLSWHSYTLTLNCHFVTLTTTTCHYIRCMCSTALSKWIIVPSGIFTKASFKPALGDALMSLTGSQSRFCRWLLFRWGFSFTSSLARYVNRRTWRRNLYILQRCGQVTCILFRCQVKSAQPLIL